MSGLKIMKNKKIILGVLILAIVAIPVVSYAATLNITVSGLFLGIWHGLLAPYSLVLRWFIPEVAMYDCQSASWMYDFGFLIGIFFSLPLGWIAAIVFLILHLA